MVTFAELKAKAEKAKDVTVTKVTNTRDRYTSMPASKANWDPNWKRAPPPPATSASASTSKPPPPPPRLRPDVIAPGAGAVPSARATDPNDPPYTPRPPPTRVSSGYPPSLHRDATNRIDWTNLSVEDKEVFFGWLDEFFSRYLGIELGPKTQRTTPSSVSATLATHTTQSAQNMRGPPTINTATRPRV